jgi:Preprotein translocase subunit SecY
LARSSWQASTVSITYRLYEEIASQQIMEMYPFMRTFFGKE